MSFGTLVVKRTSPYQSDVKCTVCWEYGMVGHPFVGPDEEFVITHACRSTLT